MKDQTSFIQYIKVATVNSFKNKWFIFSLIFLCGLTIYKILDKELQGLYIFAALCAPITLLLNQINKEIKNDEE